MFMIDSALKLVLQDLSSTVWKSHYFSITQILREINFGDSRCAKSTISAHLETVNFGFDDFLHFLKAQFDQLDKIQSLKNGKTTIL